ncbi:ribosome-associated toxin RatA of RatAB toxin-antitoxin module [Cytobacillus eiseniae]|uniref:Ribosome-associated toxin RatA of RatAB toxin-antitoxin module n=1 Tax=Cytobacillus eiseniae TaxID=762947 RepID=A0ABS4RB89_9BACI|nr:hypothetical protein [Cytobacillus eiseniae]MBP2240156.1 ribosome-associated toxin RatA of RatAB toxin-antitoxin module [Cytobacillus eiseniae]
MTTFFLLLSLFLNILALFAIVILFLRQNRLLQMEKSQEKVLADMEEVISAYLVQMKEENEAFITKVQQVEILPKLPFNSTIEKKDNVELSMKEIDQGISKGLAKETTLYNRVGKASAHKAVNTYKQYVKAESKDTQSSENDQRIKADSEVTLPPFEEEPNKTENPQKKEELKPSLINQIIELKKQGYTIEEIAQLLNKGKTEVELLLKFQSHNR